MIPRANSRYPVKLAREQQAFKFWLVGYPMHIGRGKRIGKISFALIGHESE